MLEIHAIGRPRLVLHQRPVGPAVGQKLRSILWFLAVENRPVDREQLAEYFWPDRDSSKQRTNLRQSLSRIHKLLGDIIDKEAAKIRLTQSETTWVDLEKLKQETAKDSLQFAKWLSTLSLSLLEGCDANFQGPAEEWLSIQRQHFNVLLDSCFDHCAHDMLKKGNHDLAITLGRQWLSLTPINEVAHRLLMRSLSNSGQRHAALNQYNTCREILLDELGSRPDLRTYETYREIHQSQTHSSKIRSINTEQHSYPVCKTSDWMQRRQNLFGRSSNIEQIIDLLRDPACRLLSMQGPPGIGKSWLAAGAVSEWQKTTSETIHWYDLPSKRLTTPEFCEQLASAMGHRLDGNLLPEDALTQLFINQPMLLVIDNIETSEPVASVLNKILNRATQLKVLATTRVIIPVGFGWIYPVRGLPTISTDGTPPVSRAYFLQCMKRWTVKTHTIRVTVPTPGLTRSV